MKCSHCGEEFETEWSEEEARLEAFERYGIAVAANPNFYAVVCDDCYIELTLDDVQGTA